MIRRIPPSWHALWLVLLSCKPDPIGGGPISDFPVEGDDNDSPGAGDGDYGDGDDSGDGDSGDGDTGDGDGDGPDDGGDGDGDGDSAEPGDGDGDSDDPEAPDAGDGGGLTPPSGDAGVGDGGTECTSASDGRPDDACYGLYCATTEAELDTGKSQAAACGSAEELALVCDGELSRVAAECVGENVLSPDVAASVRTCMGEAGSLSAAGDDCVECYAAEILCTFEHCVAESLSGDLAAFEACRASECGDAFHACSGLPRP